MMSSRLDLTYSSYNPTMPPTDQSQAAQWAYREFVRMSHVLNQVAQANPQVAYKAPNPPMAGMIRLAKGGWNPTSLSGYDPNVGAWVRFNGTTWKDF